MIHTNLPRNCVVFLLLSEHGRPFIGGFPFLPQMADRVSQRGKRKTIQFRVDHCILLLKHLFIINAFNKKKRLQMLFKDQLVQSKVTCSFNRSAMTLPQCTGE